MSFDHTIDAVAAAPHRASLHRLLAPALRRQTSLWLAGLVALAVGLGACGDDSNGPAATPPTAPAQNDASYQVTGLRNWYLIGDALTPGHEAISAIVRAPAGVNTVDVWLGNQPGQRLRKTTQGFAWDLDITTLAAGDYEVLFAANGNETAFARYTVHRSAPYYFLMSTDWDYGEPGIDSLSIMDTIRQQYPLLPITHFVGPYTYTDPTVTVERRAQITAWLLNAARTHKDEVALHIHPYCSFVNTTDVPCVTDQSTVYPTDTSGYTIKVAAYDEAAFGKLLDRADEIFTANGLNKPVTFRAGGWTASAATLRALASHGYVADTSANNWARMEEWLGVGNGELYRWNMTNWTPIGDTSQPYYPDMNDATMPGAAPLPLLEVPDNGIMVDYVTVEEMQQIATANWNGAALTHPKTLMVGFHPSRSLQVKYTDRVWGIVRYTDAHLAAHDRGPMVYAVLRDMPKVFTR